MNLDEARELHALGGRAAEIAAPYLPPPGGARGLDATHNQWFTVVATQDEDLLRARMVRVEYDTGFESTCTFAAVREAMAHAAAADHFAMASDGTPLRAGTAVSLCPPGRRGGRIGTVQRYESTSEHPIIVVWGGASDATPPTGYRARDLCRPSEATLLAAEIRVFLRERVVTSACEDLLGRVATFLETPP